jgi:hypothetical protein
MHTVNDSLTVFILGIVVLEVLLVLVLMAVLIMPVLVVPVRMAVLDVPVVTGSSCLRTNIVTTTSTMVQTAIYLKNKSPIIANFPNLTKQPACTPFSCPPKLPPSS